MLVRLINKAGLEHHPITVGKIYRARYEILNRINPRISILTSILYPNTLAVNDKDLVFMCITDDEGKDALYHNFRFEVIPKYKEYLIRIL